MKTCETMSTAPTHGNVEALLEHGDFLRALVGRLVVDDSTADDIVQATWLSALKHPPREGGSVRAWLYRVARNHVRQLRRGEGRRRAREQEVRTALRVPTPDEIVQRESARRAVVDAVVALGEPYRSTILLRFYEDLPPRKVAHLLDVPVETVRTRTRRGLEQLRQRLDGAYGNDRQRWSRALVPLLLARPAASASIPVAALAAVAVTCALVVVWRFAAPAAAPDPRAAAAPVALSVAEPAPTTTGVLREPEARERIVDAPSAAPAVPPASADTAPASFALTGRVTDPLGTPLPGAVVTAFAGVRPRLELDAQGAPRGALARTVTDAAGAFRLTDLPLACYLRAERGELVSAGGLAAELSAPDDLSDVELVLTPGLDARGVVVDARGDPIPDCRLELRTQARRGYVRPTAHAGLSTGALAAFVTATDAHGAFELRGLPAVKHVLQARHPDFAPRELELLPGAEPTLTVALDDGPRTAVLVLDADGASVADCELRWIADAGGDARASTDEHGRARLPAVADGTRGRVFARRAGLAPTFTQEFPAGGSVTIRLARERSISGTVIDGEGRAVAGALVEGRVAARARDGAPRAQRGLPEAVLARGSVRTNPHGRFRLGGLGNDAHRLLVTAPGSRIPGASQDVPPEGGPVRIVLGSEAPGTVSLRVRVRDADTGAPVSAAVVSARAAAGAAAETPVARGVTQQDGVWELSLPRTSPAAGGRWSLAVLAPGFAPWRRAGRTYDPSAPAIEVALHPAREVHLALRDVHGRPIQDARVAVLDPAGEPVPAQVTAGTWMGSVLAGPTGEVVLAGLPARALRLDIRVPRLPELPPIDLDLSGGPEVRERELRLPYDLSSPRREVEFELPADALLDASRAHPVEIRVRDGSGRLAAGWAAARTAAGALHVVKPLDHLVLRFDEAGMLRGAGRSRLPSDSLSRDLGPRVTVDDDGRCAFVAAVPTGPCTVELLLPDGGTALRDLPADEQRVLLEPH